MQVYRGSGAEGQLPQVVRAVGESMDDVSRRLRDVENKERAETAGGHSSILFAGLPVASASNRGWVFFVTDGCKDGEAGGMGTGVMAYSDGTGWYRFSTDTAVSN